MNVAACCPRFQLWPHKHSAATDATVLFSMFAVTYPNVYGKAPWGNLIRSSRSSFSIIQYPSLSNLSEDVWSIPKPCVQFRFQFRGSTKGQSFRKRLFRGWKERVDKAQHVLPKTFLKKKCNRGMITTVSPISPITSHCCITIIVTSVLLFYTFL